MKRIFILFAVLVLVLSFQHTKCDEKNMFVFEDVKRSDWYYTAVTELVRNGIIPDGNIFNGESFATRAEIADLFCKLDSCLGKNLKTKNKKHFDDVSETSKYFDSIMWAASNGIINGYEENNNFGPDDICEREQMCTMAMRYFDLCSVKPSALFGGEQFADSLEISPFARSYVVASRMCGLVGGDENGFFNPHLAINKAESASIIYTMMNIAVTNDESDSFVKTDKDAYTYLYDSYKTARQYFFTPYVTESEAVDLSYFDDVVMVGDSVTMSLQIYCAASGALGNAKFLCAGSLSPVNALWEVSSKSVHPSYNGAKMKLEDAISHMGAKKVYVMLGINSLAFGVDKCINDFETLLLKIKEKAPDVTFIVQSVTPMTSDSPIKTDDLNNGKIIEYNEKLLKLCEKNCWYYLNVAECMRSPEGALKKEFCSDPADMGIHFTMSADKVWTDYLKTHVPEGLKE